MVNPIRTAILRTKWPISDSMKEILQQFAEDFSQAHFDSYDEKMEPVDIEEYLIYIEEKLMEVNQLNGDTTI
jgi:hypothetical protein